jgi:MFS family permease
VLRELTAGVRHVLAPGTLRRVVLTVAVAMLVIGFGETFSFAIIDQGLHKSPAFLGVMVTVQGVGAIAGGLTCGRVLRRLGDVRLAGIGIGLFGLGALPMVLPSVPPVLAGRMIEGVGLPWAIVGLATAIQLRTPAAIQGRAYSAADALVTTPMTISIAVGAGLSTLVDYRILVLAVAVVMSACGAYLAAGGERRADRVPGAAVRGDIGDAVARHLDDRRAGGRERGVERGAERSQVLDAAVVAPVERGGM